MKLESQVALGQGHKLNSLKGITLDNYPQKLAEGEAMFSAALTYIEGNQWSPLFRKAPVARRLQDSGWGPCRTLRIASHVLMKRSRLACSLELDTST